MVRRDRYLRNRHRPWRPNRQQAEAERSHEKQVEAHYKRNGNRFEQVERPERPQNNQVNQGGCCGG